MLHQIQEIRTSSQLGMGSDFFFLRHKTHVRLYKYGDTYAVTFFLNVVGARLIA